EGMPDRGQGLESIAEMGGITELAEALAAESGVATPVSPGVIVIHTTPGPLVTAGAPGRGLGLQHVAARADIAAPSESHERELPAGASAWVAFTTPVGADEAGPIRAGEAYEVTVSARPGDRVSFAAMFGASNDWIFATVEEGIALFDGETPVAGDVTDRVRI